MKRILFIVDSMNDGGGVKRIRLIYSILKQHGHAPVIMPYYDVERNISHIINKYISFFFYIYKYIRNNSSEVIVCNSRRLYPLCKILSVIFNIQYINIVQIVYGDSPLYFKIFYSNKILSVSNAVEEYLVKNQNIKRSNICTILNSSKPLVKTNPTDLKEIRSEFNLIDEKVISCIARYDPVKGHSYLIKAFKEVLQKHPDMKLLLMGYGEYLREIKLLILKLNLEQHVIFIRSDYPISKIMSLSDFLVLPSLREGLPTMVLEAFSIGKTVIATNIPGTNEIVKHNYNGLLTEPKNVRHLASSMQKLIKNEELLKKLEMNAAKTYKSEFSFELYESKVKDFFSQA